MPVTITKPQATLRELLAGLKKRTGLFGEQIIRSETASDFYNIIGQNRNRIINGAMSIAQRGYSTTNNSGNGYASIGTLDRWGFWCSANAGFSTAQVSDAPSGFVYSTLITTVNPITLTNNTYGTFSQRIEGYNIADLAWGTANAKPITISFWIKSSLTGTFSSYVFNDGYTYCFPFTFNITTANTWTQITRTIAGPTVGLWHTDSRIGLEFGITLMNGISYSGSANAWIAGNYIIGSPTSVNLLSTSGATMNVTGVQIERGSVATPFEYRSYGTELALCQRYFQIVGGTGGTEHWAPGVMTSDKINIVYNFKHTMRVAPSWTATSFGSAYNYLNIWNGVTTSTIAGAIESYSSANSISIGFNHGGSSSAGQAGYIYFNNASARVAFSAEL